MVATFVSSGLAYGVTVAEFGAAPVRPLLAATATWLALATLLVSVVALFSTVMRSPSAAAGLGITAYIVLTGNLASGAAADWAWPVTTALLATAVAVAAAVAAFRRQEL